MNQALPSCYRHPDTPAGVVCQRCERPICPRCMHQASVGFHCPECAKKGTQRVYRGPAALQQRPVVTMVLVGLNVAVFLIGLAIDPQSFLNGSDRLLVDLGLIANGVEFTSSGATSIGVANGQWWRLLTAGFLHFGIIHLAFNMWALWILGRIMEQGIGRVRYLLVYLTSMLGGSMLAILIQPKSLTAGASGAIFGLMGAVVAVQRARGIDIRNSGIIPVLIINLLITFGVPNISVGGHLGGLVTGFLAGVILVDLPERSGLDDRVAMALCGALALGLAIAGVVIANQAGLVAVRVG